MFEWTDSLSVNIREIDEEHQKIIELMNHLLDHANKSDKAEALAKAYDVLLSYTQYHFKHEEELMERYGYPERTAHIAIHRQLEKEVVEKRAMFGENLKEAPTVAVFATLDFLKNWLKHHICEVDKRLGVYLRQCGKT